MNSELYALRDYKPEDKAFVMATILRGLYYGESWLSEMPKDLFMNEYKRIAEAIVESPSNYIKVACLKEDENVIIGYSILGNNYQTIHWCFVKSAFRKQGIGRALVPQLPASVTHLTKLGRLLLSKVGAPIFNPFLL